MKKKKSQMGVNRRIFYSELSTEGPSAASRTSRTINMKEQRVLYSNKNNHLELAGTISKVFMCKIRAEVFTTNNYTHIKIPDLPPDSFLLFSTLNF